MIGSSLQATVKGFERVLKFCDSCQHFSNFVVIDPWMHFLQPQPQKYLRTHIFITIFKKKRKIIFLLKSIKISRKSNVLTKIRKVRCPKGRSTALFACQKYLFRHFLALLAKQLSFFYIFLLFLQFLVKKHSKI